MENKINRERKKLLKNKLKAELGDKKKIVYLTAFLSWLQFLMRIISFGIIADAFYKLFSNIEFSFVLYFILIIGLNLFGYIISTFAKKYQGLASQYARDNLKEKFFEAFSNNKKDFFEDKSYSDVMTVAAQGIDSLDTYYTQYLSTTLRTFFNCATILLIVLFIYRIGGLIFIVSLPLIPVSVMLIQKKSQKIMQNYWSTYMDVGNLFMDDLKGLNTLYSYSADKIYEDEFNKKAEDFRLSTMELLKFQLQSVGYMDAVMYLGIGVSGFFAVMGLSNGSLGVFNFIFFILIATEFFTPIRELGYSMHLLMMNTKMADRIFSFLDSVEMDKKEVRSFENLGEVEKIEFDKLSFSYGERKILDDISFSIEKGNLFSIAGESGLGKSTLAKILFKEIEDFEGEILIDGKSLRDIEKNELLNSAFYLSPDSYIFNESIYENLRKAKDLSKEEMIKWIKDNNILTYIDNLPDGIDTRVGENGNLISPGQRQQIICARALLAERQIYIFDEITSSVDSQNEKDILDLIDIMSKNALVLFISHKMKQVNNADKVLFLGRDNKWYFEEPEKLHEKSLEYRTLLDKQLEMEAILYEK